MKYYILDFNFQFNQDDKLSNRQARMYKSGARSDNINLTLPELLSAVDNAAKELKDKIFVQYNKDPNKDQ